MKIAGVLVSLFLVYIAYVSQRFEHLESSYIRPAQEAEGAAIMRGDDAGYRKAYTQEEKANKCLDDLLCWTPVK